MVLPILDERHWVVVKTWQNCHRCPKTLLKTFGETITLFCDGLVLI